MADSLWIIVAGVAIAALVVGILVVRQRAEQEQTSGPPRRPTTARERRQHGLDPDAFDHSANKLRGPEQYGRETDDYAEAASYSSGPAPLFADDAEAALADEPISAYEDVPESDWEAASLADVELESMRADDRSGGTRAPAPDAVDPFATSPTSAEPAYEEPDYEEPAYEEPARFTTNRRVREITPLESDVPEPVAEYDLEPEPVPDLEPASAPADEVSAAGLVKRTPKATGEPARPMRMTAANQRPSAASRRSPEEIRRTLSSYRGGLRKGREEVDDETY